MSLVAKSPIVHLRIWGENQLFNLEGNKDTMSTRRRPSYDPFTVAAVF